MDYVIGFGLITILILIAAVATGKIKSAKFKGPKDLGLEIESPEKSSPPTNLGDTHYHGISLKEYEESLKRREQEIREEIKEAQEKDQEKIQILEMQLNAVSNKLGNPEQDLEDHKKLLAGTEQALERQPGLLPEELEQAKDALNMGNTDKAEELFEKVLKIEGKSIERAAEASYQLGLLARDRVDYETAWEVLSRAVELAPDNSLYLNEVGLMAQTLGRYDSAIKFFEKALAIDLETHGPEHPDVATCWNNLGLTWLGKGKVDKAIEYYKKALSSILKTLGPDHYHVATGWNNLGDAWRQKGEYDKAIEYLEKALDSNLQAFGPDHPYVAIRWSNLGSAWQDKGEVDKAIEYYEKALDSGLKTLGPDHPKVATRWNNLGDAWRDKGDSGKAIQYYEKALVSNLKAFGPDHPAVATNWNNLGYTWQDKGDATKAREFYNKALVVFKKAGQEHYVQVVEENLRALPPEK
jgi:tetratricopeptide (TPR) repeat protein